MAARPRGYRWNSGAPPHSRPPDLVDCLLMRQNDTVSVRRGTRRRKKMSFGLTNRRCKRRVFSSHSSFIQVLQISGFATVCNWPTADFRWQLLNYLFISQQKALSSDGKCGAFRPRSLLAFFQFPTFFLLGAKTSFKVDASIAPYLSSTHTEPPQNSWNNSIGRPSSVFMQLAKNQPPTSDSYKILDLPSAS
jgi:hypothetical protein